MSCMQEREENYTEKALSLLSLSFSQFLSEEGVPLVVTVEAEPAGFLSRLMLFHTWKRDLWLLMCPFTSTVLVSKGRALIQIFLLI